MQYFSLGAVNNFRACVRSNYLPAVRTPTGLMNIDNIVFKKSIWRTFRSRGENLMFYGITGLIYTVLVIWAIWDLLSSGRRGSSRLIWLLVILIVPVLGSILYLLLGRGRA
jgi:hypothetical protein